MGIGEKPYRACGSSGRQGARRTAGHPRTLPEPLSACAWSVRRKRLNFQPTSSRSFGRRPATRASTLLPGSSTLARSLPLTAGSGGVCRRGRYWIGQPAVARGIKTGRATKAHSHNPTSWPCSDTSTAGEPLPIARVIGLLVAAEEPAATAQATCSQGASVVCAAGRRSSGPKAGMTSSF